jgi:hypothetical protein
MPSPSSADLPPERRNWPRECKMERVLLLPEDCALEEPYGALLVDTSAGGLRLAVRGERIDAGTLLWVRPPLAPPELGWVSVLVKNRRQQEHLWEMGCAFLESPFGQGWRVFDC